MASILYNERLIVSYPVFDAVTKAWKPQIQLTLTLDKSQSFQRKRKPNALGLMPPRA